MPDDKIDAPTEGADVTPIRAKVARILNMTDLVLNKGREDGVDVGVEFVILNRNASDIVDPDTGNVIGSVPVGKTVVKVVNTQEHMSIARTFRKTESGGISTAAYLSAMLSMGSHVRNETLKTTESRAVEELDEKDSFVKVGDEAVEIVQDGEYLLPPF